MMLKPIPTNTADYNNSRYYVASNLSLGNNQVTKKEGLDWFKKGQKSKWPSPVSFIVTLSSISSCDYRYNPIIDKEQDTHRCARAHL